MTAEPQIKSLSNRRRSILFGLLVAVFLVSLPAMIFYTTGYRISLDNEEGAIVTTGGMYITTDNLNVDVYIDEEKEEGRKLFRRAYYIQRIEAGMHRVVVQGEGLQTWVKELPVDPHIVIEAAAFNMPEVPQLRPITQYVEGGLPVYFGVKNPIDIFGDATSTLEIISTSTTATSSFDVNEEYLFVDSLFSSSSTSTLSVFEKFMEGVERFRFATTSDVLVAITSEPEYVEKGDLRLEQKGGEIFAVWNSGAENIPYYFCVPVDSSSTTAERYGEHVAKAFIAFDKSTTTPVLMDSDRMCRPEIQLNRLRQDVFFYDFFPDSSDLVVLKLEDGLYVTEIDDRAWQNTQLLYAGSDFRVVIENNNIYIEDNGNYFELITEVEE